MSAAAPRRVDGGRAAVAKLRERQRAMDAPVRRRGYRSPDIPRTGHGGSSPSYSEPIEPIGVEAHAVEAQLVAALRPDRPAHSLRAGRRRSRRARSAPACRRRSGRSSRCRAPRAGRVEDVGRRVGRNVARGVEAQLRREQPTRARVVGDDEDRVDVLAAPRLELHRHAEVRREPALALVAARDVQQRRDRLREILQRRARSRTKSSSLPPRASNCGAKRVASVR